MVRRSEQIIFWEFCDFVGKILFVLISACSLESFVDCIGCDFVVQ